MSTSLISGKPLRFIGAWCFWGIDDTVSRFNLDSFLWDFKLYQWLMAKSVKCKGVYGFKYWPWGELVLWEKAE